MTMIHTVCTYKHYCTIRNALHFCIVWPLTTCLHNSACINIIYWWRRNIKRSTSLWASVNDQLQHPLVELCTLLKLISCTTLCLLLQCLLNLPKQLLLKARYTVAKFTDEQYTTINQSTARHFDPRVFVNCLRVKPDIQLHVCTVCNM